MFLERAPMQVEWQLISLEHQNRIGRVQYLLSEITEVHQIMVLHVIYVTVWY